WSTRSAPPDDWPAAESAPRAPRAPPGCACPGSARTAGIHASAFAPTPRTAPPTRAPGGGSGRQHALRSARSGQRLHRDRALDRRGVDEEVQDGTVLVDRVGQLAVALGRFGAGRDDLDADRGEAGADGGIQPEEALEIEIALGADLEAIERDPELLGPEA